LTKEKTNKKKGQTKTKQKKKKDSTPNKFYLFSL